MNTQAAASESLRTSLIGAWRLVACVETDVKTGEVYRPFGDAPEGLILYTPDGYMSAQLSASNRRKFESDDMYQGKPEEYQNAGLTYLAYSGPYYVDEAREIVEHEMFASLFPNWQGQRQVRIVTLDDDELKLSPDRPYLFNGSLKTATITWRRAQPNQADGRVPARTPENAAIDRSLQQAVESGTVAGVVAMGATQSGLVYEGASGHANSETGAAMTPDSIFWLLSMTKAITATACMQLVEQSKLRLEQPASEILSELKSPQVLEGFDASGQPKLRPARNTITVRHLLTHTSGYTYSNWSQHLSQYEKATGMPDIGYSMNGAFKAPLEFEPGERWQYGIGMDWAGKLVEAVTDQSLEVYFRERIFAPLGMSNSGFLIGGAQKRQVATLYNRQPDGSLKPAPFEVNQRPEFFAGGSGLFSTPRDYMAFLQMLLNDGTYRGERVLGAETVASMFRNHIGDLEVIELKTAQPAWSHSFDQFPGTSHKWGLSFDINTQPGPHGRSAGSASWAGLLNCYFWIDPVQRVTGSLFTQILPFYDPGVVKLFGQFEQGLYSGL
jgi:CubicO group peptidase (beta-lactamase class C family)